MNEEMYLIGEIIATWGVKGEVKINVLTDFPKRFKKGATFYIDNEKYKIESVKSLNGAMVLKLYGIDTPEDAVILKNKKMMIPESELTKLPKGVYYQHQILGISVYSEKEDLLGTVTEIIETNANDVYVIKCNDGREALIPTKGNFIKKIDIDKKQMIVEVVPGLFNK